MWKHVYTCKHSYSLCHCFDVYRLLTYLQRHMNTKHSGTRVNCQQCTKTFTREQDLTVCPMQTFRDSLPPYLQRHMNTVHGGPASRVTCQECGQTFSLSQDLGVCQVMWLFRDYLPINYLQRHMRSIHGGAAGMKTCPICGTVVSRADHLKVSTTRKVLMSCSPLCRNI